MGEGRTRARVKGAQRQGVKFGRKVSVTIQHESLPGVIW
jgi:hypothetical protein